MRRHQTRRGRHGGCGAWLMPVCLVCGGQRACKQARDGRSARPAVYSAQRTAHLPRLRLSTRSDTLRTAGPAYGSNAKGPGPRKPPIPTDEQPGPLRQCRAHGARCQRRALGCGSSAKPRRTAAARYASLRREPDKQRSCRGFWHLGLVESVKQLPLGVLIDRQVSCTSRRTCSSTGWVVATGCNRWRKASASPKVDVKLQKQQPCRHASRRQTAAAAAGSGAAARRRVHADPRASPQGAGRGQQQRGSGAKPMPTCAARLSTLSGCRENHPQILAAPPQSLPQGQPLPLRPRRGKWPRPQSPPGPLQDALYEF